MHDTEAKPGSLSAPLSTSRRTLLQSPTCLTDAIGVLSPADLSGATTLACIATDLALTRVELKRVAIMAQDGMARAIRPVHSPFDGDLVFALSTGQREVHGSRELAVLEIGALAADTLTRAIARGVYAATPWPDSQVNVALAQADR